MLFRILCFRSCFSPLVCRASKIRCKVSCFAIRTATSTFHAIFPFITIVQAAPAIPLIFLNAVDPALFHNFKTVFIPCECSQWSVNKKSIGKTEFCRCPFFSHRPYYPVLILSARLFSGGILSRSNPIAENFMKSNRKSPAAPCRCLPEVTVPLVQNPMPDACREDKHNPGEAPRLRIQSHK